MKRPLAYITAPWSNSQYENAENAAAYCRQVYDAGYSPICPVLFLPTFLKDEIPQEHKDGLDMARDYLRRSHVLVVCGHGIDETVKNDIATAERLRITATTLDGNAAVRRAILASHDIELIRLFSDVPEFRQRLHREVADETYPKLHELLRPLSDNDIDRAIQDWNGRIESKHAVVRYMKDHAREKDTAAWLAHEFDGGDGKTPFAVRPESPEGTALLWPKVQRRIAQLIKEDRFYTQVEQDNLDDVDPIAIRETLAQRGIVNGHVVEPEKLDNDPFVQQVMRDVEAISRETAQADQPEQPSPGNSRVPVSDKEYAAARGTVRERTSYDPTVPPYHVGDIVYLDDRAHQITELRDDTVELLPTGMSYPIYRAERQEQFEQLLRADNRNDFYTEFLPANPDAVDQDLRDMLAHGLIGEADKAELSQLLHNGKSNREVALWLSRAYTNIVETMELETGDTRCRCPCS